VWLKAIGAMQQYKSFSPLRIFMEVIDVFFSSKSLILLRICS
jgi:hypothetical protein